ncbi:unnamed protein product [Blepharisma stoltei]|uniref:Non-haem dioxygenase N-terminal domain-containing protein n=1 Tax=Blepharisma stoltei TaxID=1481888 RepID=A0AAU9KB85_9CILI|nr:unnamed protein product [Blepharisma stoltei]
MKIRFLSRFISSFSPVKVSYQELVSNANIERKIEEGYGPDGLGIITIEHIPGYQEKRMALLPLARRVALLPDDEKKELELPQINYMMGWSHGKEFFEGTPDFSKGSFYANPEVDKAPLYKGAFHDNVWPRSLPELRIAFRDLGQEIMRVGALLARHLDKYILARHKDYTPRTLEDIIKSHKNSAGRLLHYFPQVGSTHEWCGWHNDHSCLTGLTCPLYLNQTTGEVVNPNEVSDCKTGLFIKNRRGEMLKAHLTSDLLLYQIGETAQILSNGWLQATPHSVQTGGSLENVSRNTFAIFMEPVPDFALKVSDNHERIFVENEGIPSLRRRFKKGMTFGDFHNSTVAAFNY